ncbi:MAG: PD40 domain-containing protein [Acidobacteria bacterium]|nr:PD40 domain-containing protein [Acidobacteriota bacterium]
MIDRCLAKESGQRYASTADLHQQLRDLRDHLAEVVSTEGGMAPVAAPRPQKRAYPAWLVLLGPVVGLLLAVNLMPPPDPGVSSYRFTPFATEAADETAPAWSPDGQSLAYVARVNGVWQVLTRSRNSTVPAQITNGSADCGYPFWSTDGTRIYYLSQESLWSVAATGGPPQLVLKGVSSWGESATVSPDGKTLAFFRHDGQRMGLWFHSTQAGGSNEYKKMPFPDYFRFGQAVRFSLDGSKLVVGLVERIGIEAGYDIWLVPFPTGVPRRVPASLPRHARVLRFSWMRDNKHVVFASELGGGGSSTGYDSHLYILDTETGALRNLTGGIGGEQDPSVSPDGRSIAFVAGGTDWDLVEGSLDRAGTSTLLATSRREHSPAWSPSGRQYAYVSDARGVPEIWLRSLAEGWARPLVAGDAEGSLDRSTPCFSPDGQRIAYTRLADKHQVWIVNVAGGPPVPLEQESTDQHAPAWSPDGNWIAYDRFIEGKWEIVKAPSGGGAKPIPLTEGAGFDFKDWSPTGEWICYVRQDGLRLVSADGKAQKLIRKAVPPAFGFSKDGSKGYIVRPAANQRWELAAIDIRSGEEKKVADLNLPPFSQIRGFSLHPDGKRFATSVGTSKSDIWILEGFERPSGWLGWLRLRR